MQHKHSHGRMHPAVTLGIDPALGTTGYGVVVDEKPVARVLDAGVIRCRRDQPLEQRLLELHREVAAIIEEFKPDAVAIEQLYSHYQRPTTAILMGHARGAMMLAAVQANLEVFSYPSTNVKKTLTGNGHASKSQMQFAVRHQLGLKEVPEPADVADALAIALTHMHAAQVSNMPKGAVPPSNLGKLDSAGRSTK